MATVDQLLQAAKQAEAAGNEDDVLGCRPLAAARHPL